MLSRDGARLQAFLELRRRNGERSGPEELIILDDRTVERDWGWLFFYTTRGEQQGDLRHMLVGNAPLFVNRFDGSIRFAGTAHPADYYIAEYEAELERRHGAWELVIGGMADAPLPVVSRLRQALGMTPAEVNTLRKRLPGVWRVGARRDLEPELARLLAAGISAEIRWAGLRG